MGTLQSPRVDEKGILYWYEGDAFFLNFSMKDKKTGAQIILGQNDKFVVTFHNANTEKFVAEFYIEKMVGEFYPIHIDSEITNVFKEGLYHYDIELHRNNSETIQTILSCGEAIVEGCCKCKK